MCRRNARPQEERHSLSRGPYPSLYRTWDEFEVVAFFDSDWDTCFVAEIDEKVVGFVLGTVLEKRRSAWSYGLPRRVEGEGKRRG